MRRLFLNNADCLLEDDPKVIRSVVNCQSFLRGKLESNYKTTRFIHPVIQDPIWPSQVSQACLHCCEVFDNQPYPSVRRYDEMKNIYFVYGIFCSLNCAKAFILEHEPAISTTRLLYFEQMCRNVYGIHGPLQASLPRMRLIKFGGDLTIEEFRKTHIENVTRILEPPFLANPVLIESFSSSSSSSSSGGSTRFDEYLATHKEEPREPEEEPRHEEPEAKRKKKAKPQSFLQIAKDKILGMTSSKKRKKE